MKLKGPIKLDNIVMNKVLLERVDWIERAFINGQLTTKEVEYLLDEIDVLMEAKD